MTTTEGMESMIDESKGTLTDAEFDYPPAMMLPHLIARFIDLGNELRWRVDGTPNPLYEDEGGRCLHDADGGCSWRCVRRTKAERRATDAEVRDFIRERVGPALWTVLDGWGEDIQHVATVEEVNEVRDELSAALSRAERAEERVRALEGAIREAWPHATGHCLEMAEPECFGKMRAALSKTFAHDPLPYSDEETTR
jgi:hypothetical protein